MRHGFDTALAEAEDADFLIRLLLEETYCVLPAVVYSYSEFNTVTRQKILAQRRAERRIFWKYRGRFPLTMVHRISESLCKSAACWVAFTSGQGDRLVRRRSRSPSDQERAEFETARAAVTATAGRFFSGI